MTLKKEILVRIGVVYFICLIFGLLIIGRAVQIQIFQGKYWKEKAQELTLKDITIIPERGNILDEEGRLMASSVPSYDIRMDMKCAGLSDHEFYSKVDSLAYCLSVLFGNKSKTEYKKELISARQKQDRYFLVKRNINYLQLKESKTFPIFRHGRYKGGVIYVQQNSRVNPNDPLAKRTLGYLNKGESGNIVGLEGAYDLYLKGSEGLRMMQKISGNIWMPVHDDNEVEPVDGMDIVTTININLQDLAHMALKKQLEKYDADYGCTVLMEVETGEIKAIVNLKKTANGNYTEEYNYAIGKSSEPGSTFKLISLMAALEDGVINLNDSVDTKNGVTYYYDKKVTDTEGHEQGWVSVKRAFEVSSNVGISSIIYSNYKNNERAFIDRIYQMGLNNKLGLEIRGEAKPYIKYPGEQYWSGISLPQISMGYEVRLAPIQILSFYNAVANNGKMVKPRLVNSVMLHGKKQHLYKTEVINHSICSKSTIKKAQQLLESVVENGTAKILNDTPYKIAGKTGTAKLFDKERKIYVNEYEASFVGYFPADHPQYSCIVVIHKPRIGGYYGGVVAAPVFKEIANKVYANQFCELNVTENNKKIKPAYTKSGNKEELEFVLRKLDIPMESAETHSNWIITHCGEDRIMVDERKIIPGLVPDVTQMGAKDAVYLLENAGLRVKITGRGTVLNQSIPAGTRIQKKEWIELQMSRI